MAAKEDSTGECLVCGNPVAGGTSICPFCGSAEVEVAKEDLRIRKIDIGHNNWTENQARNALNNEFQTSYKQSDDFLIVIHGHGSSGVGGKIKAMTHQFAEQMIGMKRARDFIRGEHLTRTSSASKRVSTNYPSIKQLKEWNSRNPGLSIIILRSQRPV